MNGSEALSKFVSQSKEYIHKLFVDTKNEYKDKGEDSSLLITIFDELDATFKQRRSKSGSTGVGDAVVHRPTLDHQS